MTRPNRRRVVRLGAASLGAALTGGVVGADPSEDGGDRTDAATASDPPGSDDATAEVVDTATVQLGPTHSGPAWRDEETTGSATVIDGVERLRAALRGRSLPDERLRAVEELAARTDFAESALLLVASAGPNACYREVAVSNVAAGRRGENGCRAGEAILRADAAAVDACEGEVAAAAVLTYPAALVRVTVDGPVPRTAAVRITDGWGETGAVTASADDPLSPPGEEPASPPPDDRRG